MEYRDLSEINTATHLDRALLLLIQISVILSVVVVSIFSIYLVGGVLLLHTGDITFPYQFLSVHNDPVFNTLATVAGISIGTTCMALVFFTLLSQKNNPNVGIVLFFALIGMGFAAGLIRMSLTVTLRFVINLVP
jgi:hypothetical protein